MDTSIIPHTVRENPKVWKRQELKQYKCSCYYCTPSSWLFSCCLPGEGRAGAWKSKSCALKFGDRRGPDVFLFLFCFFPSAAKYDSFCRRKSQISVGLVQVQGSRGLPNKQYSSNTRRTRLVRAKFQSGNEEGRRPRRPRRPRFLGWVCSLDSYKY